MLVKLKYSLLYSIKLKYIDISYNLFVSSAYRRLQKFYLYSYLEHNIMHVLESLRLTYAKHWVEGGGVSARLIRILSKIYIYSISSCLPMQGFQKALCNFLNI